DTTDIRYSRTILREDFLHEVEQRVELEGFADHGNAVGELRGAAERGHDDDRHMTPRSDRVLLFQEPRSALDRVEHVIEEDEPEVAARLEDREAGARVVGLEYSIAFRAQ